MEPCRGPATATSLGSTEFILPGSVLGTRIKRRSERSGRSRRCLHPIADLNGGLRLSERIGRRTDRIGNRPFAKARRARRRVLASNLTERNRQYRRHCSRGRAPVVHPESRAFMNLATRLQFQGSESQERNETESGN